MGLVEGGDYRIPFLLVCTAGFPLWAAWAANRRTSLAQAVAWAGLAWVGWLIALTRGRGAFDPAVHRYVALGLTGCAAVAVLGARWPGAAAWNFVLLGLLAVFSPPVLAAVTAGHRLHLDFPHLLLLGGTLTVGVLNYLPTRLGPAASLLAVACAMEIAALTDGEGPRVPTLSAASAVLAGLAPWAALLSIRTRPLPRSEFDRTWLDYRDRYGLVWAQRVREQFNRSAANAGWPVILRWQGLRLQRGEMPDPATQEATVSVLRSLLKRFIPEPAPPSESCD